MVPAFVERNLEGGALCWIPPVQEAGADATEKDSREGGTAGAHAVARLRTVIAAAVNGANHARRSMDAGVSAARPAGMPDRGRRARWLPKRARLTLGEGRRGWQPRSRISGFSDGFIVGLAEEGSKSLESVSIAPRGGAGRDAQDFAGRLVGEPVPEPQDDHFTLFDREPREGGGRRVGEPRVGGVAFEPAGGLEFAAQATPDRAVMIQGAVPEGADEIEPRFARRGAQFEQRAEGVMKHVFGLGMTQPEGAAVQHELGGATVVELRRPVILSLTVGMHAAQ